MTEQPQVVLQVVATADAVVTRAADNEDKDED